MKAKAIAGLAFLFAGFVLSASARAYLTQTLPYDMMFRESDLVVIATPVDRRELAIDAVLPGVIVVETQQPVPAIALETTFRAVVVIKGSLTPPAEFVLFYFKARRVDPISTGGPMLVDFEAGSRDQYLMFLRRLKDGRYEAFNRNEPGSCIEKLAQRFPPAPAGAAPSGPR